jgi:hypothetical protein
MAEDAAVIRGAMAFRDSTSGNVLINGNFNCVQCMELMSQLKETMEKLKSAQLIIELLRQESATNITSIQDGTSQDHTNQNNISHVTTKQVINDKWIEVNSKHYGVTSNGKNKLLLNKSQIRAQVPFTTTNRYSILEEENTVQGCINQVVDCNVVENKSNNKDSPKNREGRNEQSEISKVSHNLNDLLEVQRTQESPHVNQDIDTNNKCFKIPTLINGSIIRENGDSFQRSHGSSIILNNPTNAGSIKSTSVVQHKVFLLGDSHIRGSPVKLRSEFSPQFKVFGVIRPGAGAERIMNSFAEDLQSLHTHDFVILNAG